VVPYRLFIILFRCIGAVQAGRILEQHDAVEMGISTALGVTAHQGQLSELRAKAYGEQVDG
jgi:hypothetical protein